MSFKVLHSLLSKQGLSYLSSRFPQVHVIELEPRLVLRDLRGKTRELTIEPKHGIAVTKPEVQLDSHCSSPCIIRRRGKASREQGRRSEDASGGQGGSRA